MTTTVGRLRLSEINGYTSLVWKIDALPHVVMRLKRIFPRLETSRKGTLILHDTFETAREIEWVLGMYPLDMDPDVAAYLTKQADQYRARAQAIDDILGGNGGQMSLVLTDPGMTPRPYQEEFVQLLAVVKRIILGDATGVGKTITSALGFALPDALPAAIAMPTHLPAQWGRKMAELWPDLASHTVIGTRPYELSGRAGPGRYPDILFVPYSRLGGWAPALAGQVKSVIFEEVQELRTGRFTQKGQGAAQIANGANYVTGQSATPAYNYGSEFWNIIDIIKPGALGSRDEFLREWGADKERVSDPAAFGTYLRSAGLMLARSRKDVALDMDPVVPEVMPIGTPPGLVESIDPDISDLASQIVAGQFSREERLLLGGQLSWKLRRATGIAKAPLVADAVRLLLESEDKVVLYGWHRDVYDIWLKRLKDFNPVMVTGSETPAEKDASVQAFMTPTGKPGSSRLLIVSLRSGSGIDGLQEVCSALAFGELDWSPKVHTQAIERIDRPGQTSPVLAVYFVCDDGSDPVIAEVLGLKAQNTDPIMDPTVKLFTLKPGAGEDGEKSRMQALAEAWVNSRPKAVNRG